MPLIRLVASTTKKNTTTTKKATTRKKATTTKKVTTTTKKVITTTKKATTTTTTTKSTTTMTLAPTSTTTTVRITSASFGYVTFAYAVDNGFNGSVLLTIAPTNATPPNTVQVWYTQDMTYTNKQSVIGTFASSSISGSGIVCRYNCSVGGIPKGIYYMRSSITISGLSEVVSGSQAVVIGGT